MGCICCGRDVPLEKLPAHMGNLGACAPCVSRHGAQKLADEADRLLTEWYFGKQPPPVCLVCGDPVLIDSKGVRPLWCQKCEDKRVAYTHAHANG
jgi:hypothetical protein